MPGWRGRADARAGNGAPADATVVDPRAYRFREGRARSGPRCRGRRDDNRRGIRRRGRRVSPTARSRADVYVDTDLDASARVVLRDVRDVVATLGAA